MTPRTLSRSQSLSNVRATTSWPAKASTDAGRTEGTEPARDGEPQPVSVTEIGQLQAVNKVGPLSAPNELLPAPAQATDGTEAAPNQALEGAPHEAPPEPLEEAPPAVTDKEVQDARDKVKESRADIRKLNRDMKREARNAALFTSMQAFVDKLARKHGPLDALKQLFAQAEHVCLHRAQQLIEQVEQASSTLQQHQDQVRMLSRLAQGQQPDTGKAVPPNTAHPAKTLTPEQEKELDSLIGKLEGPEQNFVKKAAKRAQDVIDEPLAWDPWDDEITDSEAENYRVRIAQLENELAALNEGDDRPVLDTPPAASGNPSTLSYGQLHGLASSKLRDTNDE